MLQAIIDDGYTWRGLIRGEKGMYPDVIIEYRKCTITTRARYNDFISRRSDGERLSQETVERRGAEVLVKQLVSWDVMDNGHAVPVTTENLLRLHPALWNRLYAIVIGMSTSPDEILNQDIGDASYRASTENVTLDEYLEKNS